MTLGERIKHIRKDQNLTQQVFGERIGVKQNTIALIESGKRNTSDQLLLSICREFNVNENWLQNEDGEVYCMVDADSELTKIFSAITMSDDKLIKRIIQAYWKLSDNEKATIKKLIDSFLQDETGKDKIMYDMLSTENKPNKPFATSDIVARVEALEHENAKLKQLLEQEDELLKPWDHSAAG